MVTWEEVVERFKGYTFDGRKLDIQPWKDAATIHMRGPEWALEWISGGYDIPPPWMYWPYGLKTLKQLHKYAEGAWFIRHGTR